MKRLFPQFIILATVLAGVTGGHALSVHAHSSSTFADLYINAGGGAFTDSLGNDWIADTLYNTGNTWITGSSINGTTDDAIYQSERWDPVAAPDLQYAITVPNGDYDVVLHFADIYYGTHAVGARVFDVSLEGQLFLDDLDIYAEAGPDTALVKSGTTTVTDGILTIDFDHVVENPKIAGIEVHALPAPVPFLMFDYIDLDFGTVEVGQTSLAQVLTLTNDGQEDIAISDISLIGTDASDFSFDFINGQSNVLTPQETLIVTGDFTPALAGNKSAQIQVTSNSVAGPLPYAVTTPGTPGAAYEILDGEIVPSISIDSITGDEYVGYQINLSTTNFTFEFFDPMGPHVPGEGHAHLYIDGVKQGRVYNTTSTLPSMLPGAHDIEVVLSTNNHLEYQDNAIPIGDSVNLVVPETISTIPLIGVGSDVAPPPSTDLFINAGGGAFTDSLGNDWIADTLYNTGNTWTTGSAINGTTDDALYQSERWDPIDAPDLQYEITVPNGDYDVILHFADIYYGTHAVGARVFDVSLEGQLFLDDLDIYAEAGPDTALVKSGTTTVTDGILTIDFDHVVENPKLSGIEVHSTSGGTPNHFAHAVPGAAQTVVDGDFSGFEDVTLNGAFSHTHAFGENINSWIWSIGTTVIASTEIAVVSLPVGVHTITLDVLDTAGNAASDTTTVTVENGGVPDINSLSPNQGDLAGGTLVTINGTGFTALPVDTIVNFGTTQLTGASLNIIDINTIEVTSPAGVGTAQVSVETPAGTSTSNDFTYINTSLPPIQFVQGLAATGIIGPTTLAFGPDKRLYVGTQAGEVHALTLDSNHNVVSSVVSDVIQTSEPSFRTILGIAFDPFETDPLNPKVYASHSSLFHGEQINFYNGKVSTLSGPGLSIKEDIITGLPVSDHDHGINGLEFDNEGKLYIQVGGNTNAGVPGVLSSSGLQKEGVLSAATLVADIKNPGFDGGITYDATAAQISGDVSVFASGQRNPYDILLHSNGYMYGTDNGPNNGFGQRSVDCSNSGPDPSEGDELNLLVQDGYYGHANRARGTTDPRQCIWRSNTESSDADYTAPITHFPASTNGLIEYRADSFGGQLRKHVIASRYIGEVIDVQLSPDGGSVLSNTTLLADGGLDIIQGPDGTLFIAEVFNNQIIFYTPVEPVATDIRVINTFPYRGPITGGNTLVISGDALTDFGTPSVTVGGQICSVTASSNNEIECTIPTGTTVGSFDVVVSAGGHTDTLTNSYTYIALPAGSAWTTAAIAPSALGEVSTVTDGTYVYLLAGHTDTTQSDQVYRYDPIADTWTILAPQNVVPLGDHVTTQYINGRIYLFGGLLTGSTESNALGIYDIASNTWSVGAPLTLGGSAYGLGSVSSGVVNGRLYIAGGIHNGSHSGDSTAAFVYDPVTDTWLQITSMPSGRNHAAGGVLGNDFYIFSGRQGPNQSSPGFSDTFIYDTIDDSWSFGAPIPTPRSGIGNAPEAGGELYVFGGEVGGPFNGAYDTVEAYNPATNTWRAVENMPTARHGIYPVLHNSFIHVIAGGPQEGHGISDIHEIFNTNATVTPPNPTLPTEVRINVGGEAYVDSLSNMWAADSLFNTGSAYSITQPISGTIDDILFQTERWDLDTVPELTYVIPIANGAYNIKILLSDIYEGTHAVGARQFGISLEGVTVETGIDIYNEVGGFAALTRTYPIVVTDENVSLILLHDIENPKISGIEIVPQ